MKRTIALLLVLVTVATVFAGCKPNPELSVFHDWIGANGFAPDMGRKGFELSISNYTYLGKALKAEGQSVEAEGSTKYTVGGDYWSFSSDESSKDGVKHYFYNFSFSKNLDNLPLPGGIRFGDAQEDCIEALGLKGKNLNAKDIKIASRTCELSLNDNILIYKDHSDYLNERNVIIKVTRSLIFKFVNGNLHEFSVTISEDHPPK